MTTILKQTQVSAPPATVADGSLPLTYFDILWLTFPPIQNLFFYQLPISKTNFTQTIVPNLKQSLSITLKHFFPFAGNLIVFLDHTIKPEIRYAEGDSVAFTVAESTLDFDDLTGNHPRDCDKFYHLIPFLAKPIKESDHLKIPVFSVQVTFFENRGISIGMTNHHSLGDASTRFNFLKTWTSVAQTGSDESFLAKGTLPIYDRSMLQNPKREEFYSKFAKVETIDEDYEVPKLCIPSGKVRATFVLTRTTINRLKEKVSTEHPGLPYVSAFTVGCGYIWSCLAETRKDELQLFGHAVDCRTRMNPPIPGAYFGNCVGGCMSVAKRAVITGKDGFVMAAKMLGENLHKTLTDKDGVIKDEWDLGDLFADGMPTAMYGVAGTPRLKFYDIDLGLVKPKKQETISIDHNTSISLSASRESSDDLEIGVSLTPTEMDVFVGAFNDGLKGYL